MKKIISLMLTLSIMTIICCVSTVYADPMPEVTDFTNYNVSMNETGANGTLSGLADSPFTNRAITNNFGNYVLKFKFQQKSVATASNHLYQMKIGYDKFILYPYDGKIVYGTIDSPQTITNTNNPYIFVNDIITVYDIYVSKSGAVFTFGIKNGTESSYTWFQVTSLANDSSLINFGTSAPSNACQSTLYAQTFGYQGSVMDMKLYNPKEYMTAISYDSSVANKITVNIDVTRTISTASDSAVFVTAIYKISDGIITMTDISATAPTALTLDTPIPFSNTVDIPTLSTGETYTVRSFLWNSFADITPIMPAFDMPQE